MPPGVVLWTQGSGLGTCAIADIKAQSIKGYAPTVFSQNLHLKSWHKSYDFKLTDQQSPDWFPGVTG